MNFPAKSLAAWLIPDTPRADLYTLTHKTFWETFFPPSPLLTSSPSSAACWTWWSCFHTKGKSLHLPSLLPSPVPHSLSPPWAGRIPRAEHAISLQGAAAATGKMQKHNQKEHLYKLLVIGDLGVGKTSIIKRYVHQNFSPHYRATIGVDFALKVLSWDAETVVRLQLWDIAGE